MNIDQYGSVRLHGIVSRSRVATKLAIFAASNLIWAIAGGAYILMWNVAEGEGRGSGIMVMTLTVLVAWLITLGLERAIGRKRPFQQNGASKPLIQMLWIPPSFPSAHATIAFTLAVMASQIDASLSIPFLAAAAAVSVGRVAVGVHYLSDVIVGALIGHVCGMFVYLFLIGIAVSL